jgi:hypothetical protein
MAMMSCQQAILVGSSVCIHVQKELIAAKAAVPPAEIQHSLRPRLVLRGQ